MMRQLILDFTRDPLPAFDGFLPGDNAAVVAQMRAQAWPGPTMPGIVHCVPFAALLTAQVAGW